MHIATVDDVYNLLSQGQSIHDKGVFIHPVKTKGKAKRLSLGRIWFNLILPDDFELIDEPVNQSKLDEIVLEIAKRYEPAQASEIIFSLQKHAFNLATFFSNFRVEGFILPDSVTEEKNRIRKEKNLLDPQEFSKRANSIVTQIIRHLEDSNPRFLDMIRSGARGSVDALRQLLVSKGYVYSLDGNIHGPLNAINDGYSIDEFYKAASEGRAGFYFKAVAAEKPGYLTKRIASANADLLVTDTVDCGSKRYISVMADNARIKYLVGRYYVKDGRLKKIERPEPLNEEIKLRSPIYCLEPKGVCQICYGDKWKELQTKRVGLLAAGAINVVYLNSLMKLRHKAVMFEIEKVNFLEYLNKYPALRKDILKYFLVEPTKIVSKKQTEIIMSREDYPKDTFIETAEYVLVPGIFNVKIEDETIQFPFDFKVKLYKREGFFEEDSVMHFVYEPYEVVIEQEFFEKSTDVDTIDHIFEGRAKYLGTPEMMLDVLSKKLPVDLVHLELLISNMFRDRETKEPCRLHGYRNCRVYGQKALPFMNWFSGLGFENINKALKEGLLRGTEADLNPLTSLIVENYS
ncbi:MAG: hypothetical protein QW835_00350 [Candidatus Hadarchaeum sp.]